MPCTGGTFTVKLETYHNQVSSYNLNTFAPIQRYFTPISSNSYKISSTTQFNTLIASTPMLAQGVGVNSSGFTSNLANRLNLGTLDIYHVTSSLGSCRDAEYIRVVGGKYQKVSLCDSAFPGKISLFANWVPSVATLFDPDVYDQNLWYGANGMTRDPLNGATPLINSWRTTAIGISSYSESNGLIQTGPISSYDPSVGSRALPIVIPSGGVYGQYLLSQGRQVGVPFTMTSYVRGGGIYVAIDVNYVLDYCSLEPITNDYTMLPFNPAGSNTLKYPLGQSLVLSLDAGKSRKNLITVGTNVNVSVSPFPPRFVSYAASMLIDTTCDACV